MNEATLNEADTRAELIDPALKDAGWGVVEGSRVRREMITLGRLQGAGKRGKQDVSNTIKSTAEDWSVVHGFTVMQKVQIAKTVRVVS